MRKFLPLIYAGIVGVGVGYSLATIVASRDQTMDVQQSPDTTVPVFNPFLQNLRREFPSATLEDYQLLSAMRQTLNSYRQAQERFKLEHSESRYGTVEEVSAKFPWALEGPEGQTVVKSGKYTYGFSITLTNSAITIPRATCNLTFHDAGMGRTDRVYCP